MRHVSFELEKRPNLIINGEAKVQCFGFAVEEIVLVYWLEFSKDPEQPTEMRKSTLVNFFSDVGGGDVLFSAYSYRDMELLFKLLKMPEPKDIIFSSTSNSASFYLEELPV